MNESANKWFAGSAFVAAFASSLCCVLPVISVALGLGAFGVASVFETLRPYLLIVAVLALGFGFYQTYFRREKCKESEACATKPIGRFNQVVLWLATIGVVTFALFPYFAGYIASALDTPQPTAEMNQTVNQQPPDTENSVIPNSAENAASESENQDRKTVVIAVEGMTCEGCASQLNVALKRQKGVISAEASYANKNVKVVYNPKQTTVEKIKEAIRNAGYDPK